MNKIIKLLGMIIGLSFSQFIVTSAPACAVATKNLPAAGQEKGTPRDVFKTLKSFLEDYHSLYSHSVEKLRHAIDTQNSEYTTMVKDIILNVDYLSKQGVLDTITDEDGNTLLMLAGHYKCLPMFTHLIVHKGFNNFDAKNKFGYKAIFYLKALGEIDSFSNDQEKQAKNRQEFFLNLLREALQGNYNLDSLTSHGNNYPYMITYITYLIGFLYTENVLCTITDKEENTPLILVTKYKCFPAIKYLIEQCGVTNFDAKNMYGRTAYDYVRTPSDLIGSSESDDETSVKVQDDQIVSLKHKPVIHGNKKVAEYLKSERLRYKFEQAAARNSRLTKPKAQDAKKAAQRANRNADKKQNSDTTLEKIREKTLTAIAARTESQRTQAAGAHSETPAQQVEEATQLALIQAQKEQEETQKKEQAQIKQENNIIYKLKMDRVKAERTKKLLQEWKWAALESKRKKEVSKNGISYAFKMRAVHEDPYWHTRYQGDAQASIVRNALVVKEGLNAKDAVQWWHDHKQENCTVCEKYKQAQLAAAAQPKKLERRKSF